MADRAQTMFWLRTLVNFPGVTSICEVSALWPTIGFWASGERYELRYRLNRELTLFGDKIPHPEVVAGITREIGGKINPEFIRPGRGEKQYRYVWVDATIPVAV